ncbi:expressed unknown protein [Seminavis robusta]|uniref:DUF7640 domain-containing protein n=1 Tax=Seminavis robusta TaxID=568900 RepID=A0A9N8DWP1_9STRA|nr:expressed unknown protein [Seminavis robusta]|eukprot:Sro351_g123990.1 n/a (309) ;mRNA; r:47104-48030
MSPLSTLIKLFALASCATTALAAGEDTAASATNLRGGGGHADLTHRRAVAAACFYGTDQDVTNSCTSGGHNCCQGQNACSWSGEREVCAGSCNGQAACLRPNVERIAPDSCNGLGACQEVATATTIGENSCNGQAACLGFDGQAIADDSCNNYQACHNVNAPGIAEVSGCNEFAECDEHEFRDSFTGTGAEVTAACDGRCCVGTDACVWTWTKTVGLGSCMGTRACENNGATTIGRDSCNGLGACRGNRLATIGSNACNDYAACFELKAQNVADYSCNGWQSCRRADATNLEWLEGCNDTAECEEREF